VEASDVLIVVDVQVDFVSGSMAIPGSESIIPVINALMPRFRTVVLAQDWHPPGHVSFASAHAGAKHGGTVQTRYGTQRVFNDHCVQGSKGAQFAPGLDLDCAELILRKGYRREVDSFSAFYENDGTTRTGLAEYLHGRGMKRVYCAGLSRYGCVKATAEGARRDGFEVFMVEEASAGRATDDSPTMEKSLAQQGIRWVNPRALV
jgi:nicotinamidase/pyrazinamidase